MNWPPVDNEKPDVVVDASNVCFEDRLGSSAAVDLFRIARLADAWRKQQGPAKFSVIADQSLGRRHLPEQQRHLYRNLVRSRQLIEVPYADPVFLDVADRSGAAVLSNDQFKDLRREYRWLETVERCFGWTISGDSIHIVDRDLGRLLPADESYHAELKEFHGAVDRRPWFCDRCGWGPPIDDPECGGCGRLRIEARPVEGAVGVVVETPFEGNELRFVLSPGEELQLGRSTPGLTTDALGEAAETMSRSHIVIRHDGRAVLAKDTSSNGTTLFKWYPGGQDGAPAYEEHGELDSHDWTALGRRDLALIGDGVAVRVSGRRDPWGHWVRSRG